MEEHEDRPSTSPNWSRLSPGRSHSPSLSNHSQRAANTTDGEETEEATGGLAQHGGSKIVRDESPRFFHIIGVQNPAKRKDNLVRILRVLEEALSGGDEGRKFIQGHLRTMVRLSVECPYPEVRRTFSGFLRTLEMVTSSSLLFTTLHFTSHSPKRSMK